jgi:tetratricopeptide (TPR) repeat protein
MKKTIFSEIKDNIKDCVANARLRDAFALARNLSEGNMAWEISDALNEAEQSYQRLLSYAVSGAEDPARDTMTAELGETILTITDRLERNNTAKEEPTLYYNLLRFQQTRPQETIASQLQLYSKQCSEQSLLDIVASGTHSQKYLTTTSERELMERSIFNLLWVTFPLTRADAEAVREIMMANVLPNHANVLFTWALVLGGLEFFDPRRLELLCDLYTTGSEQTTAVALIGLLMVMHRWRDRHFSRTLTDRFAAVRELPGWKSDVKLAYMELIRTRDTDRITAKIRDEIVPEMMKLRPEFERKMSNNPERISPEEMEDNPEWQEMLDQSGITDRLKEMSEIQEEGGDVMMGTFSHLKQFPFFNEIANWFVPFHCERSEFADGGLQKLAEMFEGLGPLCDSDMYSMMISLSTIHGVQRDALINQLNQQTEQFNALKAASLDRPLDDRKQIIRKQVQNLYRFTRLFRRKGEFYNPFMNCVNLASVPALVDDVKEPELLMLVAEFYFTHGYWTEALDVFEVIDSISTPSASLYQKIGHALMKLGRTSAALSYFEKADMLDNQSAWTIGRLARCYTLLGKHASALSACERLEELRPDQPLNSLAMGRAHLALKHYPEAIKAFYKAFYLDEKSGKALRPLAWSLLMDKQFDQSRKYYERILTEFDPMPEDYLNMGHLSLATGNFPEAQNFYRLSILSRTAPVEPAAPTDRNIPKDRNVPKSSIDSFIADIKADTPALAHLGIAPNLIPLITDALLYSLRY